jgi:pimeloyl-ACP methyl ester carboxylesterase
MIPQLDEKKIKSLKLQYHQSERIKTNNNIELYYEQYGNSAGSTIVIVNNFFIISPLWKNFTKELAEHHQIITYDLRNQGASSIVDQKIKFEDLVEDIKSVLDQLNINKAVLVGTSTSTLMCRDFAIKYPERMEALVMVGPIFCPFGSRRRKFLTKSWLTSIRLGGIEALFAHIFPLIYSDRTIETGGTPAFLALKQRFIAINSAEQIEKFLEASLTTEDGADKLTQIKCPTLLFSGESDFLNCKSSLHASAKLIPQGEFYQIDFCGHVPYFEANEKFETLIINFLKKNKNKALAYPAN